MKLPRIIDSRVGSLGAAAFMLLGLAAPAMLTAPVGAAQVTARSITMSNTAASATAVDYKVQFTPVSNAGVTVVEFCSSSPVITETCTAPAGFSSASATVDTGTVAAGYAGSTASVKVTTALTAGTPVAFTLSGITNPNYITSSGTGFFARIVTYTDATQAANYTALGTYGTHIDDGGIALATTDPIQVKAVIRETMTFCVSDKSAVPTVGCGGVATPNVVLGHGSPAALDATATDTDDAYAQISTNASSGAVVYMKNSNSCGGLYRAGATAGVCDIPPVGTGTDAITLGTAKFGMKISAITPLSGSTGTINKDASYDGTSGYGMNWVSGNATGVGSTYGDAIFDSNNAPVTNQNVKMTFAATASPNTPAGSYSAAMNLIAVGKF